jgi:transposase
MDTMINLKQLNPHELHAVRKQVVRLKQKGLSGKEIASLTGVRPNRISEIWSMYKKHGEKGLKPLPRGRKRGEKALLAPDQEKEIRQTIIDKTPDQLKLSFGLWTRQAISDMVKRIYKIDISLRCVTNYLKRWGFTCQRPTTKPYAQDDIKVNRFMNEEYPKIAERAAKENAEIYWGDETGVSNQEHYQRGFSPKGVTPVMRAEARKERIQMISAITARGTLRFMVYDGAMNQKLLITFMRRLVSDAGRKVFLVLDNLRVHHGKQVNAWLEKNNDKIELFFIPPYSPELNPDEYLNHVLKKDVHSGVRPRTKKDLRHKTESFLRRMQRNKEKVRRLFLHPKLDYIRLAAPDCP